jgi:membrane protein DedA with SNARE-associated domain
MSDALAHEHHAVEVEPEGLYVHLGRRRVRLEHLLVALMLGVALAAVVSLWTLDLGTDDLERWGYGGLFLIALLRSASVVIPVPAPGLIFGAGALLDSAWGVPAPILVGLVAGVAESFGEMTGYAAGMGGSTLARKSRLYAGVKRRVQKQPFTTVLVLSLFPSPVFDVAGLAAGASRIPIRLFYPPLLIGKIARATFWAAAGYFGVDLIGDLFF